MTEHQQWFAHITGLGWAPHDRQSDLADFQTCSKRLVAHPHGLGKTEGTRPDWPRRVVWCRPMRVLVEQDAERAHAHQRRSLVGRFPTVNQDCLAVL